MRKKVIILTSTAATIEEESLFPQSVLRQAQDDRMREKLGMESVSAAQNISIKMIV